MGRHMRNGDQVSFTLPVVYYEFCCDCRLAHFVLLEKKKNKIVMTKYRDDRLTNEARRKIRPKKA